MRYRTRKRPTRPSDRRRRRVVVRAAGGVVGRRAAQRIDDFL